jgi:hypothetical protein
MGRRIREAGRAERAAASRAAVTVGVGGRVFERTPLEGRNSPKMRASRLMGITDIWRWVVQLSSPGTSRDTSGFALGL